MHKEKIKIVPWEENEIEVVRIFNRKDLEKLTRGTIIEGEFNLGRGFLVYEHINEGEVLFDIYLDREINGFLIPINEIELIKGKIYVGRCKQIHYGKSGRRLLRAIKYLKEAGLINNNQGVTL